MPRRVDVWDDAVFALRTRGVRNLLRALAAFVALCLVGLASVSVVWYFQVRPSVPSEGLQDVPLNSLGAGYVSMAHCVYEGPAECDSYDEATEGMISAASGQALIYQPVTDDAPGVDAGAGTRSVVPSEDLTDEEWHALAASLTLDGAVNPGTVTEESMTADTEGSTVTFTADDSEGTSRTGTMVFVVDDAGVRMSSVNYSPGATE